MARDATHRKAGGEVSLIFPWRGLDGPSTPKVLAGLVVLGVFAFMLAFVRVDVKAAPRWVEKKASVIYLPAGPDGEMWARRAREGGPFPSRFDPRSWEGMRELEREAMRSAREPAAAYVPRLRDLPEVDPVPPVSLAAKGERVFPKRAAPSVGGPVAGAKLAPRLYPLAEIPLESMPAELPAFDAPVSPEMASTPWRFLLRLRPDGRVVDSLSLVGASEAGALLLENWLREVKFGAEVAAGREWLAVGVGFVNKPDHGAATR